MKFSWHILTILMAVALVMMSFKIVTTNNSGRMVQLNTAEVVYNAIMTRTSIRRYTPQTVEPETIEKLLRAGMAAPTAGNRQPWEFYVVRDTSIIRQLPTVTKFADPMAQEASVVIVVCGVPSESFPIEPRYWVQDVSAATENILLATHALGLGAVWSGVYPGEERVATLRNLLDVPEKLIPFNIIFLGHTDAEPIIKDKWKPEKVHYKD